MLGHSACIRLTLSARKGRRLSHILYARWLFLVAMLTLNEWYLSVIIFTDTRSIGKLLIVHTIVSTIGVIIHITCGPLKVEKPHPGLLLILSSIDPINFILNMFIRGLFSALWLNAVCLIFFYSVTFECENLNWLKIKLQSMSYSQIVNSNLGLTFTAK